MTAQTYTVVACYADPPSMFCTTVEAETPEDAIEAAWRECLKSNWGDTDPATSSVKRDDEWTDIMVIRGTVEVVA